MKRKVIVIGIGAGNPDYVTMQAIKALNLASVFFIPHKGSEKDGLARLRLDICDRYIERDDYRMVDFDTPARAKKEPDYAQGVADWRHAVEQVYERLLTDELKEDEIGAFLIWGDPSIYDGTLRILENISAKGVIALDYEVVPGISSVQALAARHKIALNRIGEAITITTGRNLASGLHEGAGSVTVMLDAQNAFRSMPADMEIHWGAYVGTDAEILLAGRLSEVGDEIERVRAAARAENGWIMDSYILTMSEDDTKA